MTSSAPIFDWLCLELARRSALPLPQSRGTIRLALKDAGLEPRTLGKAQALVIVERVLPHELEVRGIANAAAHCAAIVQSLRLLQLEQAGPESAESIFARLGNR